MEGIDKSNMKGVIEAMPVQIREAYHITTNIAIKGSVDQIYICGMGGSSIAGMIIESYAASEECKIPIYNVQDYALPESVAKNSLVILSSYSGNTEETLSCYKDAQRKGLNIIIITSDGKLKEYAIQRMHPFIELPKGLQPRNAIVYSFCAIIKLLENAKLLSSQEDNVKNLIDYLGRNKKSYDDIAQDLAQKIKGTIPIIYSSNKLFPIAYRWKCEFNENTKIPAFANKFPELNHNEIVGYANIAKIGMPVTIIMLKDDTDLKRIIKRMDLTKKLLKEQNIEKLGFIDFSIKGHDFLTRIFSAIYVGDLTSYYLAISYSTDPTPVNIIEKFKKELGPYIQ